jgi:hypothetical protein
MVRCPPLQSRSSGLAASFRFQLGDVADRDVAWLQLVGNTPRQVDVEQPVLERGALDLDVVGQIEATLERARAEMP